MIRNDPLVICINDEVIGPNVGLMIEGRKKLSQDTLMVNSRNRDLNKIHNKLEWDKELHCLVKKGTEVSFRFEETVRYNLMIYRTMRDDGKKFELILVVNWLLRPRNIALTSIKHWTLA